MTHCLFILRKVIMRGFIITPFRYLYLGPGSGRIFIRSRNSVKCSGKFANSLSSKSALDFACCSSILAWDSACAVRCCRVAEEIDIVEVVASESSILVSEFFLMLFGITKIY